jgi:hypothetical protein
LSICLTAKDIKTVFVNCFPQSVCLICLLWRKLVCPSAPSDLFLIPTYAVADERYREPVSLCHLIASDVATDADRQLFANKLFTSTSFLDAVNRRTTMYEVDGQHNKAARVGREMVAAASKRE